jgi:hypothetical protein
MIRLGTSVGVRELRRILKGGEGDVDWGVDDATVRGGIKGVFLLLVYYIRMITLLSDCSDSSSISISSWYHYLYYAGYRDRLCDVCTVYSRLFEVKVEVNQSDSHTDRRV